jgi:hypothetical protein
VPESVRVEDEREFDGVVPLELLSVLESLLLAELGITRRALGLNDCGWLVSSSRENVRVN